MVMVTRSAHRKISSSFDSNSTDVSHKNVVPPWCSSGKVYERKKLRKVAPPTWEIRSSYPLRENIWEYLHDDKNFSYKRKNKKSFCKQKPRKNNRCRKTVILLAFLSIVLGVTIFLWMSDSHPKTNLIIKIIARTNLISLLGLENASVDEECCYRMKHLAAALLRAEEALRGTLRLRRTMMLTAQTIRVDPQHSIERDSIQGATATKGRGTSEWGGRVALWGAVPLWRAAPPPDTVLAARNPAPSDCWPFSGQYGELIIDLPRMLLVKSISIEHVRPDIARSAPKHFILYAVLENSTWVKAVDSEYRYKGPTKQYYLLLTRNIPLRRLIFRVLSNQGNPQYTCIYRVHLYGFVDI